MQNGTILELQHVPVQLLHFCVPSVFLRVNVLQSGCEFLCCELHRNVLQFQHALAYMCVHSQPLWSQESLHIMCETCLVVTPLSKLYYTVKCPPICVYCVTCVELNPEVSLRCI